MIPQPRLIIALRPLTLFAQVFRNALLNKEVAIKAINDPFIDLEYMYSRSPSHTRHNSRLAG
jgi:hypothetical protein